MYIIYTAVCMGSQPASGKVVRFVFIFFYRKIENTSEKDVFMSVMSYKESVS